MVASLVAHVRVARTNQAVFNLIPSLMIVWTGKHGASVQLSMNSPLPREILIDKVHVLDIYSIEPVDFPPYNTLHPSGHSLYRSLSRSDPRRVTLNLLYMDRCQRIELSPLTKV